MDLVERLKQRSALALLRQVTLRLVNLQPNLMPRYHAPLLLAIEMLGKLYRSLVFAFPALLLVFLVLLALLPALTLVLALAQLVLAANLAFPPLARPVRAAVAVRVTAAGPAAALA